MFPYFEDIENRKKTYEEFDLILINNAKNRLSEAGFFYIQSMERICCFSCGGTLTDISDYENFWIEHAFWFPKCKFVKKEKGLDFVKNASLEKSRLINQYEEKLREEHKDSLHEIIDIIVKKRKSKDIKINNNNTEKNCVICYSQEKKIIFLPCGHYVACEQCSSKITNCPMCRKDIFNYQIVYKS
jgi:baculoviral IAP repeat-containing protein 7/8